MTHRREPTDLLHTEFMRVAKRRWRHLAMADSTGQKLTFGRTLVGSLLLADVIRERTTGEDQGRRCCCRRRSAARSPTSRR